MSDVFAIYYRYFCIDETTIHSLYMHNQTGDSQTSTSSILISWDLLCLFCYLSYFKLIDWEDLQSVEIDLFSFSVKHISLLCVYIHIHEIDPLVSMIVFKKKEKEKARLSSLHIVYIGTRWHIHFLFCFFQLCIYIYFKINLSRTTEDIFIGLSMYFISYERLLVSLVRWLLKGNRRVSTLLLLFSRNHWEK